MTLPVSHAEALRAKAEVLLKLARNEFAAYGEAREACNAGAKAIYKLEEAALAIPSPDLRAFIEQMRHEAHEESGGAWEAGYAHGLLHAANGLAALLGDPVR